jgi:pyruvate,orthophosphate dikinase
MCDVEFTVENGRLWLLQTRVGKRGAVAAIRCAVQMVADPTIQLTEEEALDRATPDLRDKARAEVLAGAGTTRPEHVKVTTGLGVSPGRVAGRVVLSSIEAATSDGQVILVRPETSPEDIAGMAAAAGILTTTGGLVSHAAVVARGWHLPAVVGAKELTVLGRNVTTAAGLKICAGDVITIDGATGEVWLGDATHDARPLSAEDEAALIGAVLPELLVLESWESTRKTTEGDEKR